MSEITIFDAQNTAQRLPFSAIIDALECGFAEGCQAPVRHHHTMSRQDEPDATLLLMPAWSNMKDPKQYLGVKLVTVVPGNSARNMPGLVSSYILYDGVTGEQLAVMDGNTITGRRTVATSALAARYLSRKDSSKLLVIGAGRVASLIPAAYHTIRPIEEVTIWDINPENAYRFAEKLKEEGMRATVADDLEKAVKAADIVSAATLATEPLIKGAWLTPGTHVDLIGGFRPDMREADEDAVSISAVYVDTDEALIEAGDLVQPIRKGIFDKNQVRGTLAQLTRGEITGRSCDEQVTYFKAVGSALADLVAARMVYTFS
jgi:ornithine cyclodeaminase/alanine dehydrogenase-like protein (mu-crystallin family)